MSRIFEALRRSRPETGAHTTSEAVLKDLVGPFEAAPSTLEQGGSVHCAVCPEAHIVAGGTLAGIGSEKFRTLRHRLCQERIDRPLKRVLVTSSVPQEGKTVVSVNLAVTLGLHSSTVLLVDGDLRRQGVRRVLGLESQPGLADYVEGRGELATLVHRAEGMGFHYLPAGNPSTNPVELFQSPRMHELFAQLTATFDWVILDSPPVHPFADARCLAMLADAVLLVVRPGVTPREIARQTVASLKGSYIVGVVMNASDDEYHEGYYYNYYYGRPRGTTPARAAGSGSPEVAHRG